MSKEGGDDKIADFKKRQEEILEGFRRRQEQELERFKQKQGSKNGNVNQGQEDNQNLQNDISGSQGLPVQNQDVPAVTNKSVVSQNGSNIGSNSTLVQAKQGVQPQGLPPSTPPQVPSFPGNNSQPSFFARHKVTSVFLGIFLFIILGMVLLLAFGGQSSSTSPRLSSSELQVQDGVMKLSLQKGEFIPEDTLVRVTSETGEVSELSLKDILGVNPTEGSYYLKNGDLEGYGLGFGAPGKSVSYNFVTFQFQVLDEIDSVPQEQQQKVPQEQQQTVPQEQQQTVPQEQQTISNQSTDLALDTTPPTTGVLAKSPPGGASYTFGSTTPNSVKVFLGCSDAGSASSGCDFTLYCLDTANTCSPNRQYTEEITISTTGTSYIRYYSIDKEGNSETVNSKTVKIQTQQDDGGNDDGGDSGGGDSGGGDSGGGGGGTGYGIFIDSFVVKDLSNGFYEGGFNIGELFTYDLDEGKTAMLVPGSVKADDKVSVSDEVLEFEIIQSQLIVNVKEGSSLQSSFGSDSVTEESVYIQGNLPSISTGTNYKVQLVHGGKVILGN